MDDAALRKALARIQRLVERETGKRLRGEGARSLRRILKESAPAVARREAGEYLKREVTILLTDLRGFTSVSETYPVGVVLELLNHYLVEMSKVIARHGGTIDKFMGDSIMVLFGVPQAHDDDVRRAAACAVDMQIAMDALNARQRQIGMPALYMGIGLNTGVVMAGMLGSDLYSEYTVIGDEVNLASRIEAVSLRGQVLISERTYERCGEYVQVGEPMDAPGGVRKREVGRDVADPGRGVAHASLVASAAGTLNQRPGGFPAPVGTDRLSVRSGAWRAFAAASGGACRGGGPLRRCCHRSRP